MDISAFKPLNLQQLYQGADAAVAQSMQTNLLVMQAGRMKKEFDAEDALRDLAKTSTTIGPDGTPTMDLKAYARGAYAIDPNKGMAIEKAMRESEKTALEMANVQGQVDERRMKMAADRLKHQNEASTVPFLKYKELTEKGVPDADARAQVQPLYQTAIQNLVSSGLFKPEELQKFNLAPEFDPTKAEAGMRQVLGAKDSLAEYWKGRDFKATEGRDAEAKRHNLQTEKQARDALSQSERHHLATQEAAGNEVKQNEDGTWVVIDKKTKTATPVVDKTTGKVVGAGGKALNEAQGNAVAFGARMEHANATLDQLSTAGYTSPGIVSRGVKEIPIIGEVAANNMTAITDPKAQQYWQAVRNFTTATLRKESGANINKSEFETEYQKYFPQSGDTNEVIKQKTEARALAVEAMKQQAGPTYEKHASEIRANLAKTGGKITQTFATEADAIAARKSNKLKNGDKIVVNGVPGTWQD